MLKYFQIHITFVLFFGIHQLSAQNPDIVILDKINNYDTVSFFHDVMSGVSHTVTPVNAALPLALFITGLARDDKELKRQSLFWALTFAGNTLVTSAIKRGVNRERPFMEHSVIFQKADVHDASYPSGHTSAAFAAATTVSLYYPKWYIIAPSFAWAGTVAYSRMYLGVHFPSDVIAGAAVGIGTAFLSKKINEKMLSRKKTQPLAY